MKSLNRVKRMINLLTEVVLLKDKLDEDEKELLLAYVDYTSAETRYKTILNKFER